MVAGQACKEDLEGILRGEKLRPSLRREKYGRTSDGPKKVILVVGMNKAAPDLDSAMARVKHYAAPINNIRLGLKNPCVETGLCSDCKTPQRICNMWGIIEGHMIKDRVHVKLVGDALGY